MKSSWTLLHTGCYIYAYFFWSLNTIKMKLGQILVCCMINTPNVFFSQCWRLETSCRPFHDFIKMKIYQDLAIFSGWHLPFLNVPYSSFQKNKTLEWWPNWSLSNWSRLINWEGHGTLPQSSELLKKIPENYCPCLYLWIGQV